MMAIKEETMKMCFGFIYFYSKDSVKLLGPYRAEALKERVEVDLDGENSRAYLV